MRAVIRRLLTISVEIDELAQRFPVQANERGLVVGAEPAQSQALSFVEDVLEAGGLLFDRPDDAYDTIQLGKS